MMKFPEETDPRNWQEDFDLRNGKYFCRCRDCERTFIGHKSRFVCKECFSEKPKTKPEKTLFTKRDLEKAWIHGELRKPDELTHLNNFNEYFKHLYDE